MKTTRISFLILMLLCTSCKKDIVLPEDIEQDLSTEIKNNGIPSISAVIVDEDEVLWEFTYGYAHVKNQTAAHPLTLYQAMSISKLFIATAAMQLNELKGFDIDDDINEHLPFEVRNPKYPELLINSRMLMNHTSGMAWPNGER